MLYINSSGICGRSVKPTVIWTVLLFDFHVATRVLVPFIVLIVGSYFCLVEHCALYSNDTAEIYVDLNTLNDIRNQTKGRAKR